MYVEERPLPVLKESFASLPDRMILANSPLDKAQKSSSFASVYAQNQITHVRPEIRLEVSE